VIDTTKTRFTRNTPSKSTRWLANYLIEEKIESPLILDFGAGKGRNSFFLRQQFSAELGGSILPYDVSKPEDTFYDVKYLLKEHLPFIQSVNWDFVICNFVLNVLSKQKRSNVVKLLDTIKWKRLIIEVRSKGEIERSKGENWIPFDDGWLTTRQTFQKGFSARQIKRLPFSKIKKKKVIVDGDSVGVLFERKN